ncbi:MAG: right-handed parallel beta-helix repeat-containing protein [Acidobacteriaceae bacterium]|nr:right-handed parallel beta-helix repeat-containing protein [Acidobacteriaceae bacterium]
MLLKKGDIWREQLSPTRSGTAAAPITFDVYGTGNAPIISGADVLLGWQKGILQTVNVAVSAGGDDAYDDGSNLWNSTPYVVLSTPGAARHSGFRFQNIGIKQGTTISSATISLYYYDAAYDSPNLNIYAEASDNASSFLSGNPWPGNRPLTTASVPWNRTQVGTGREPIPVTGPVQEVINRPGWQSGNALNIIGYGRSSVRHAADVLGYEGGAPAVLNIAYIAGYAPNVWSISLATRPNQLFINGVRAQAVSSLYGLIANNQWYFDAAAKVLYVYSSINPNSLLIEASQRSFAAEVQAVSHVQINNIAFQKSNGFGVDVNNSSNVTINNSELSWNGSSGLDVQEGSFNIEMYGGSSHDNGFVPEGDNNNVGLGGLGKGSSNLTISGVDIYNAANDNIEVSSTDIAGEVLTGVLIEGCNIHGGGAGGIRVSGPGHSVTIQYNNIFGTADHGIVSSQSEPGTPSNLSVYGNTVVSNLHAGAYFLNGVVQMNNNLFYNNNAAGTGPYFELGAENTVASFSSDYNLAFETADPQGWYWYFHGSGYRLSDYKALSGQDAHSVDADPDLVAPALLNFSLQPSSPASEAGTIIPGVTPGSALAPNIGAN